MNPSEQQAKEQGEGQSGPLKDAQNRILRNRLILYTTLAVIVVAPLLSISLNILDLRDRIFGEPKSPPSPRMVNAAYSLGHDIFPLAFGRSLNAPQAEAVIEDLESRTRANLTLLGLNVKIPTDRSTEKFVALMKEQIRPKLASRDDNLVDWYDYGLYWGEQSMGLELIIAYTGPKAPGDPAKNVRAMSGLLPDLKDKGDYDTVVRAERNLDLPRELFQRAEGIRKQIDSLGTPLDRGQIQTVNEAVKGYHQSVLQHIGV
jgi:hypothetical protein